MTKRFDFAGIVPWGRRFDEYRWFFGFDAFPIVDPVLDVGGGPASFTAEAVAQGLSAVAIDPLYAFEPEAILERFEQTRTAMMDGVRRARDKFVWTHYGSPDALEARRRAALEIFLDDYQRFRRTGRYVAGKLPTLPFADNAFGTALCSHLMFLYGAELDVSFHATAIVELMRVARELRVFPLIDLEGRPSAQLADVTAALRERDLEPQIVGVPFEFQRGAREMLRVTRKRA